MKRFLGFVVKEFYHIFRDYRTLLILFGLPAIQLLLFGFVITNEIKNAKIAILDQSRDEVTRRISEKVLSSGYFILEKNLRSSGEIGQVFRQGNVKLVLIFGPDFAKNLDKTGNAKVQIIGDASDPNTANILVNYIQGILSNYIISLNAEKIPLQIIPEVRMLYNGQMKGVYMMVPGLMAMLLMLISALMTSLSITKEKELGTMELLLVSPLKPVQIIIGKVFPYVFLAFCRCLYYNHSREYRFRCPGCRKCCTFAGRKLSFYLHGPFTGDPYLNDNEQPANSHDDLPGCTYASYYPAQRVHFPG